jgi:RNA polymerase sigma-70 factor (ECF subfamily)
MTADDPKPNVSAAADEQRLVERARQGDARAFGQLYQHNVDRVYSFVIFRVRDKAVAEDLTQDVFLQMLRGLDSFDWRGSLAPWLLRIARNTVVDHWRRRGRRPERTLTAVEAGDEDEDDNRINRLVAEEDAGLSRAEQSLDRARIARAATHLTELQQQVLALRFAAGLSIRETAEAMGKSEGAIKNLQHHAVRSLRFHLHLSTADEDEAPPVDNG